MRKSYALLAALTLAAVAPLRAADLLEVYQRAQEADPQMAAAEAAYRAGQQARPIARSAFLPKLNASGRVGRLNIENNLDGSTSESDTTSYALSLLLPIYHQDYFVQLRQANARVTQAEAKLAAANEGLVVRAANAYFGVLAAQDNLRFAEAEKTAIEQQLRQTRQRFEVGLTAITDVREAQARFDLAVAQEIAARNQLATTIEQLRELTGAEFASLAQLGDVPLVVPEPSDIDAWVATALDKNLALIATEAGSRIAREEVRRQRAQGFPTLDAIGSYEHSETPSLLPQPRDANDTFVGVQLNWPLFTGGLVSSRTREAEALSQQSQAQLEQQRRATVRQTRDAYQGVQAGISQVEALKQALASAQTALDATQAGYEVGTRTAVDVLDAQRQLFLAQRNYASARYDYVVSTLSLKQAAGILAEDDLRQVNSWLAQTTPTSTGATDSPP